MGLECETPLSAVMKPGHPRDRPMAGGSRESLLGDKSMDELVTALRALHRCHVYGRAIKVLVRTARPDDEVDAFLEEAFSHIPADPPPRGPDEERYCAAEPVPSDNGFVHPLGVAFRIPTSGGGGSVILDFPVDPVDELDAKAWLPRRFAALEHFLRNNEPDVQPWFRKSYLAFKSVRSISVRANIRGRTFERVANMTSAELWNAHLDTADRFFSWMNFVKQQSDSALEKWYEESLKIEKLMHADPRRRMIRLDKEVLPAMHAGVGREMLDDKLLVRLG
eukprot:Polyplicarium_translucidae@DN3367_c0_g2_i1.p1